MQPGDRSGCMLAYSIGIQVCINGGMAGIRMAAPLLALREGYSAATVGALLALFALVQLFLAIPAGRFADRHGVRRPIKLCIAFAVFGAALATLWPSVPVLAVTAVLTGSATGTAVIALQRYGGRIAHHPTQLKQVFSWLAIAPSLANFLGPFLAGLIIDHAGFRACFAAMGMLSLGAWWLVVRVEEAPIRAREKTARKSSAWALLADRKIRLLMFVSWIMTSCWDIHTFVLPILGHERDFSATVIGSILGAFALAATAVRLVMPMIAARLREWAVIMASMIVTAVIYAIYPLLQSPLAMGLSSALLGFFLGSAQPMVMSMLHLITPERQQGEAIGLRMMSINLSNILMPLFFGSLGAVVGVTSIFWFVGAVTGSSAVAAKKLKKWSERQAG